VRRNKATLADHEDRKTAAIHRTRAGNQRPFGRNSGAGWPQPAAGNCASHDAALCSRVILHQILRAVKELFAVPLNIAAGGGTNPNAGVRNHGAPGPDCRAQNRHRPELTVHECGINRLNVDAYRSLEHPGTLEGIFAHLLDNAPVMRYTFTEGLQKTTIPNPYASIVRCRSSRRFPCPG